MSFTKKQASEITGLPMRGIQYYTERMLVIPEVDPGEGKGQNRRYSKKNLVEFGVIKELTEYSMAFSQIKRVMHILRFPIPDGRLDAPSQQMNMAGIIGKWESLPEEAYVVLYRIRDNFKHVFTAGMKSVGDILIEQYQNKAESILIINLSTIINKVKKA